MQKDRGARVLSIIAICVAIVGLSIGYSVLSTTLTINTNATLKGVSWDIHFDNMQAASVTGTAAQVTAPVVGTTDITLDVSLTKPGDKISYTFDVANSGDLDAKLSAAPTLSATGNEDVNYTLTYSDGSAIQANDALTAGESKTLLLTVEYDSDATTVATTDTTLELTASMMYVQQ